MKFSSGPLKPLVMLVAILSALTTIMSQSWADAASSATYNFSDPVSVLTSDDMQSMGFRGYPDMPIGVIREPSGEYAIFGSGFSLNLKAMPQGTYKFVGTLNHFEPAKSGSRWPRPSLLDGLAQPSPDGSDFDADYAGGGPTYILAADPRWNNQPILLQIYHGEYHYNTNGHIWYGVSGMAISYDDGKSFVKIGQILSPSMTRDDFYQAVMQRPRKMGGLSSDGFLIEADASGRAITDVKANPDQVYYYILFGDVLTGDKSLKEGIAIARVKKVEALDAIAHKKAPAFKKYYQNDFTEPGLGGNAALLVTEAARPGHVAQPQVLYNAYLKKFILCYMINQKKILLRTSDDLFHWSDPVVAFESTDPDFHVYYPSMAGQGADPAVLDKEFFLYFIVRPPTSWNNAALKQEKITIEEK